MLIRLNRPILGFAVLILALNHIKDGSILNYWRWDPNLNSSALWDLIRGNDVYPCTWPKLTKTVNCVNEESVVGVAAFVGAATFSTFQELGPSTSTIILYFVR